MNRKIAVVAGSRRLFREWCLDNNLDPTHPLLHYVERELDLHGRLFAGLWRAYGADEGVFALARRRVQP